MELAIIFLLATLIFGLLTYRTKDNGFGFGLLTILAAFFTVCSLSGLATTSKKYEEFMLERNSFEQTIKSFKVSPNQNTLEVTALTKDVIVWNYKLAKLKYDNQKWYLDDLIDDRFNQVEPIK